MMMPVQVVVLESVLVSGLFCRASADLIAIAQNTGIDSEKSTLLKRREVLRKARFGNPKSGVSANFTTLAL